MVRNCLVCNTPFVTYPSKVKIGRGKYCSKKCCLTITAVIPQDKYKFKKGHKTHNFKGFRLCGRKNNYREIWVKGRGYVREHRLVMEKHLGRRLDKTEEIHHIDGDGLNNELYNLMILSKSEHLKLEHRNGRYKKS